MKRGILFIFAAILSCSLHAVTYKDVTKSKTMTVGQTITINPFSDMGMSSGYVVSGGHKISNESAFTVTSTKKTTGHGPYNYNGSTNGYYYVYTVKALKPGTYTFTGTVSYIDPVGMYGDFLITSSKATYNITVVDVTSISIPSTLSLQIGATYTMSPVITDSRATTTLTWKSSNTSVATVSNGKITAKAIGTTEISCTASNGVAAKCKVTVEPIWVTSITLNKTSAELVTGKTLSLTATVAPSNATNKKVTWSSSDNSVATVSSSGSVTAKNPGQCTITATAQDGSNTSGSCYITVIPVMVTSVSIISNTTLFLGDSKQLSASVYPSNAANKHIEWSSSNSTVASVDGNGLVTANSRGTCYITATATDGSNKSSRCQVTVYGEELYISSTVSVPGGTVVLPIYLKNLSEITGVQFELQLPEGVSVEQDNKGKLQAELSERAADQSITGSKMDNGNYQFVVFSGTSSALAGSSGAVAYITLKVSEELAMGDYYITMKNIEITNTEGLSIHNNDIKSYLKLTETTLGDVNGDSKVTVTDAVGIVNYILHRTPSVFITNVADVNGDGSITISDAVGIVNIVLNK